LHPYAEFYVHKRLASDQLFIRNSQLLSDQSPAAVLSTADDGITKNLVGRLSTAAVVKNAMTTSLNAIHRAAGIEVPDEKQVQKSKTPKRLNKDTTKLPQQIVSADNQLRKPAQQTTSPQQTFADESGSDSDDNDIQDDEQSINSAMSSRSASPEPIDRRTLLPALSTGYIPASDSSDPDEEYTRFAPVKKIRKNRRGQRERQTIWLKKYGSAANHLHPELHPPKPQNNKRQGNESTTTEAVPTEVKKVNDPHPSWVAKQKLREQQNAIMKSVKAKKIVFQ
jgi:hypothetical protein